MEKYKDMTIKKKSNLKMLRNLIFFILLIVFTFWFIFKDQDINEIFKAIRSVNLIYVLMGLICMFFTYIIESYNVRNILVSLGEKKRDALPSLLYKRFSEPKTDSFLPFFVIKLSIILSVDTAAH